MIAAVLFDIDGVLVDSEPLHDEALRDAMRDVLGGASCASSLDHIGLSLPETMRVLGIAREAQALVAAAYAGIYCARLTAGLLREGVVDLWRSLVARDIPFGCVTSAERSVAEANIALLTGIATPPLVAREDVARTKPAPDPYLSLARRLSREPQDCLAVEDSDTGLLSAHRAGVGTRLAFPHGASGGQSYALATGRISRLTQIEELL